MTTGGNAWVETKPGVEHFLKGIHLQSSGWDGPGNYDYIPDSRVLGSSNVVLEKSIFKIKTLVHATTPVAAAGILENGFKPNRKDLGPQFSKTNNNLIWWGISPDPKDTEKYSQDCETFTKELMMKEYENHLSDKWKDDLNDNFCSSPPFCITSRYGNISFEYNIDQLLKAYSSQYCDNEEPAFLVLGTFAYSQEVMHTIIVCPQEATELTRDLLRMDKLISVIYKADGHWVWRPETTGYHANVYNTHYKNIEYKKYRRWEHASFAFLIPDDNNQGLLLDNLDMHMTYCQPSSMFRVHTTIDVQPLTINETLEILYNKKILDTNLVLGFIRKFLLNNWKKKQKLCENSDLKWSELDVEYLKRLLGGSREDVLSKRRMNDLLKIIMRNK